MQRILPACVLAALLGAAAAFAPAARSAARSAALRTPSRSPQLVCGEGRDGPCAAALVARASAEDLEEGPDAGDSALRSSARRVASRPGVKALRAVGGQLRPSKGAMKVAFAAFAVLAVPSAALAYTYRKYRGPSWGDYVGYALGGSCLVGGAVWAHIAEKNEQKRIKGAHSRYKKLEKEFMNVKGQAQSDDDLASELRDRLAGKGKGKEGGDGKPPPPEGRAGRKAGGPKRPPPSGPSGVKRSTDPNRPPPSAPSGMGGSDSPPAAGKDAEALRRMWDARYSEGDAGPKPSGGGPPRPSGGDDDDLLS